MIYLLLIGKWKIDYSFLTIVKITDKYIGQHMI